MLKQLLNSDSFIQRLNLEPCLEYRHKWFIDDLVPALRQERLKRIESIALAIAVARAVEYHPRDYGWRMLDGRYFARGFLPHYGYAEYLKLGKHLMIPLVEHADYLLEEEIATKALVATLAEMDTDVLCLSQLKFKLAKQDKIAEGLPEMVDQVYYAILEEAGLSV